MIGVILAAGKGKRIAEITGGKPKSFLELGGVRLIDHQIRTLRRYGVQDLVLIIGYQGDRFEKEYREANTTLVTNPFYESSNVLASLWFARDYLAGGFYFMHADTYFEPGIFKDLTRQKGEIVLAVQAKDSVIEDMKVRVENGCIVEVSKEMDCASAYGEFIGLAKINSSGASKVIEKMRHRIECQGGLDDFFEAAIQDLIDEGIKVVNFDIGDRMAIEIDFPDDYKMAKELYHSIES